MSTRIWPHLDDAEYLRRASIIREHFPAFVPCLALAEEGTEVAFQAYQDYLGAAPALLLTETFARFVRQVIHSSVDLIYTADGENYRDRSEAQTAFDEACQQALVGRQTATIARLVQHVASQCLVVLPDGSDDEQLGALRAALCGDGSLQYHAASPLLSFERQSAFVNADPWTGDGYALAMYDSVGVAENWAVEPTLQERLSTHPSPRVMSAVLSNPITAPGTLATGLGLLPYPTELWARIDEDEGNSCELPEWAEEEMDETDLLAWSEILNTNPIIDPEVITALGHKIVGHLKENDVWASILLHPNCPPSWLESMFEQATPGNWQLLCVAANPNTPPQVLEKMALFDSSCSLELVENLRVTMNEVLVGVTINPSTPIESRAVLAMLGNEQVNLALRATAAT